MRDRLIELIDEAINGEETSTANIAHYLREHGVIVPPCKVGDTVYYISFTKIFKGECHAITIHSNSVQVHLYDYDGDNASYSAKDIFLTKEEAEKALKEREIDV